MLEMAKHCMCKSVVGLNAPAQGWQKQTITSGNVINFPEPALFVWYDASVFIDPLPAIACKVKLRFPGSSASSKVSLPNEHDKRACLAWSMRPCAQCFLVVHSY